MCSPTSAVMAIVSLILLATKVFRDTLEYRYSHSLARRSLAQRKVAKSQEQAPSATCTSFVSIACTTQPPVAAD